MLHRAPPFGQTKEIVTYLDKADHADPQLLYGRSLFEVAAAVLGVAVVAGVAVLLLPGLSVLLRLLGVVLLLPLLASQYIPGLLHMLFLMGSF